MNTYTIKDSITNEHLFTCKANNQKEAFIKMHASCKNGKQIFIGMPVVTIY